MLKRIFLPLSILAVLSGSALAEENLSPAELALQQQQLNVKAARFQALCERIILDGDEPKRSEFIASLNNQTCAEAAQAAINNPPTNP